MYPDAQDILENISKTREFWNSQLPNSPPPASSDSEDTPTERDKPVTSPPPTVEHSDAVRTDKTIYPQGSFEAMTSLGSPQASQRRYVVPCWSPPKTSSSMYAILKAIHARVGFGLVLGLGPRLVLVSEQ